MRVTYLFFLILFSLQTSFAQKKLKMSPYQSNIKQCLGASVDVYKIDSNRDVYRYIQANYSLVYSETLYREVVFKQKEGMKKIKLEMGKIITYAVSEDDSLMLLGTEKIGDKSINNELRQKPLSADARMDQLLFQADIRSDYAKIHEVRSKQLSLTLEKNNSNIKSLNIDFENGKRSLNCQKLEAQEICSCRD